MITSVTQLPVLDGTTRDTVTSVARSARESSAPMPPSLYQKPRSICRRTLLIYAAQCFIATTKNQYWCTAKTLKPNRGTSGAIEYYSTSTELHLYIEHSVTGTLAGSEVRGGIELRSARRGCGSL